MKEIVDAVVSEMRPALESGGVGLEIRELTEDLAEFDLIFGPDACEQCILPPETIEYMLTEQIEPRLGRSIKIVVNEVR